MSRPAPELRKNCFDAGSALRIRGDFLAGIGSQAARRAEGRNRSRQERGDGTACSTLNLTGLALAYRRPQFLPLQASDIPGIQTLRDPDTESFIGPQRVSNPITTTRCAFMRTLVVRFGGICGCDSVIMVEDHPYRRT